MRMGVRVAARARVVLGLIALAIGGGGVAIGCGGGTRGATDADGDDTAGDEQPPTPAASAWLDTVPEGGSLTYEVVIAAGAPRRVQMQVQEVVRRGSAIAILLAPVGTPLDTEPVFARWMVGEEAVLAGLDQTASLTEPGYAPIDEAGRMGTEAADNIAWRLPREWLTPGRAIAGEETSAGWQLAERVGDLPAPHAGRSCARLEREEAGARTTLVVCANLGVVESTRTAADGSIAERWALVSVDAPRTGTDDATAEMH